MKLISFVMPTLNEEEGIVKTINSIPKMTLKNKGFSTEIIVIDGGSTDNTIKLAKKAGAKVVSSAKGYGKQYKIGLNTAKGKIIITGDSDNTYPFEKANYFLDYLEKNNLDFVTINRFANMEKGAMHFSNKIGNIILTFFTNLLFNLNLQDSQSGMWIIKKSILKYLNLSSDGMPFSQEIKIESFKKFNSAELNGSYKKRVGETKLVKFKDGFKNLFALFHKRLF